MVNQFGIRNNFIRNIAISIEFSIFCSQQIHPLCERFHAIYAPIKTVDCDLVFLWSKIQVQVKSHTKWCTNQSDAIISSKSMRLVLACNTLYGVSICERGEGSSYCIRAVRGYNRESIAVVRKRAHITSTVMFVACDFRPFYM